MEINFYFFFKLIIWGYITSTKNYYLLLILSKKEKLFLMDEGKQGPNPSPENNLNNGNPRSPFGAAWAKYSGPSLLDKWDKIHRVDLPFVNINKPLFNRNEIRKALKGFHIVYIWTNVPSGACLVGSTKQYSGTERFGHYLEYASFLNQTRLFFQYLRWLGYKDMQLSIIQLDPRYYSIIDMYTLEQFYINHLNSKFNAIKSVPFARNNSIEDLITNKPSLPIDLNSPNKPVYIYDSSLTKLLYIANSANNATMVLETGSESIRNSIKENKLFLNYFFCHLINYLIQQRITCFLGKN